MAKIPLSVQLYTLRDRCNQDMPGTLKALGEIGYKGVELAGFGSLKTAAEVRKAVDDAGLVVSGMHLGIDGFLGADAAKAAEDQKILGNSHVICPWVALDGKPEADYRAFALQLEQAGATAAKLGLTMCYHNHSFEHKPLRKGLDGLDVIFGNTHPDHVKAELDLYWVQHGGHDPAKYIEKMGKRCVLVHLKDMEVGPDRRFANVGEGIIDFRAIVAAGQKVGVRWYVVEQDNCYGQDPLDAVRVSYGNLQKMGLV